MFVLKTIASTNDDDGDDDDRVDNDSNFAKRLLIKDLLKVFDNYESSKCLLWEIVRTFHPIHTAALLFCMENITKSYKSSTLSVKTEPSLRSTNNLNHRDENNDVRLMEIDESTTTAQRGVVLCCTRPTLRLKRCERDYVNLPSFKDMTDVTAGRDRFNNLTIFGLIRMLQNPTTTTMANDYNDDKNNCTVYERIVMHNLRTRAYTQFSQNLLHQLLPEHMQQSRHEASSINKRMMASNDSEEIGMHVKFLQFYESFYNDGASLQREARTFRQLNRPRPALVYEKPSNMHDYCVQPRYVGYNVVINAAKTNTRTYNRYGELLHSVLYQKRFPMHATFEAMLVPLDESGRPRSWRYARSHRNNGDGSTSRTTSNVMGIMTCQNFALYVVDVFRVRDKLLINEPFHRRVGYARLLECENVHVCDTRAGDDRGHALWDALERGHNEPTTLDPFAPINGVVLRGKNDTALCRSRQYVFSSNVIYNFQKNALTRVSGDCSMRLALDAYFSPDMAELCTVVTIYAHDDQFYYVCRFDRNLFTFVHDVCLDRVCDVWRTRLRYTKDKVYVQDAKLMPMGMAFLRIYHNDNRDFKNVRHDSRRTIVAYESKITTSMYDVPFKRTRWFV